MGLIQAFAGAVGGTLGDAWKDYYEPMSNISPTSIVFRAVQHRTDSGRGSNTHGSENVITNGSKIVVPEGTALILLQDGKITSYADVPGGYIYNSTDINSASFISGNPIGSSIRQSFERFKFGGIPGAQQIAIYVNMKEVPNNKFGTQSEIYWDDAYLGAQVGAITRGVYSLHVVDPIRLVCGFIPSNYSGPNAPVFDMNDMNNPCGEQLFTEVVGSLSAAFSMYTNDPSKGNRITKIQSDQLGLAACLSQAVENAYQWRSGRGIEIMRVAIAAIEYDEDTRRLLSDVKKADALSGNRGNAFMQQSVARGMQAAGENGGAQGMAFMGMGMQAGGAAMGSLYQQASQQPQQAQPSNTITKDKLIEMKELLDLGIITQEEFDEVKASYLNSIKFN